MIQAIGLTSRPQSSESASDSGHGDDRDRGTDRDRGDATVRGLTFEAAPGEVTVLLGDPGAGKTAAVRRLLQLDPGRGTALFNGRPLSRIAVPAREVGTVLGDVAGHPARTLRAHLRMLAAAIGVPAVRADDVLELVGLDALAGDRLDTLALGMDRRLGLATALLGDPHTLVLDDPARDLSHREAAWYHATLRELAGTGICVFTTTADPRTAARLADRVLSLDAGRIVADQPAAEFARTRLRSCVTVRTPQAERLATYLARTASTPDTRVEVVRHEGNRLDVYGLTSAAVGEIAFRGGVLVHQLADYSTVSAPPAPSAEPVLPPADPAFTGEARTTRVPGPAHPLRYEIRRMATGPRVPRLAAALTVLASVAGAALLAHSGGADASGVRMLTGWHPALPLPPVAIGAGFVGAHAFAQEFRYPALAAAFGGVPRRFGLLVAKLVVATAVALALLVAVVFADASALLVGYGDIVDLPANWATSMAGWAVLSIGCAWTGVLAAGVFRHASLGLAAVLTVPVAVSPLLGEFAATGAARRIAELPLRVQEVFPMPWPAGAARLLSTDLGPAAQPVGQALLLSLLALLGAYTLTATRSRAR